jgi:hypothetical protein
MPDSVRDRQRPHHRAARVRRPQSQLDLLEPPRLDPLDHPLEAADIVVIVPQRERAMHAQPSPAQPLDQLRQRLGPTVTNPTERVEVDEQLSTEIPRQRVERLPGLQQLVGCNGASPRQHGSHRSCDRLLGVERSRGHGSSTVQQRPLFRGDTLRRMDSISRGAALLLLALPLACADDGSTSTGFASFGEVGDGDGDGATTEADTESADAVGDGDGDTGDGDGDSGDGDGDTGDGDGDGDTGDGDGDGDTGDGDGDGDTGDGDGDTGDGDGDTGGNCIQCGVTLNSTQSSSFVALQGTTYLGYATLPPDNIIYALDEVGNGRVIYTADTNLLYNEITDCPLWEWLGQTGDQLPKVLSFGRQLCGGLGNNLLNYPDLTYAGTNLPAQYVNNPALLAAEYDMVIYCTVGSTPAAELSTIVDYVQDQGGGLYLASEYWGFLNQADVDAINEIAVPFGTQFETTNLNWGQANGDIAFQCFPNPQ